MSEDARVVRGALHDLYHYTAELSNEHGGRSQTWGAGMKAISRLEARLAEVTAGSPHELHRYPHLWSSAREGLRLEVLDRPPATEGRDTYADGYTSGLVHALQLLAQLDGEQR